MSLIEFDPQTALAVLHRHAVRFVLIGGLAAREHGSPRITNDLDICYARDDGNLQRLAAALRELRAVLRGAADDVSFILDAATLKRGDHLTFLTRAGGLDCLGSPAGAPRYERLEKNSIVMKLFGMPTLVSSLDDLINMKLAAGRDQDIADANTLTALRGEIEETQ